MGYGLKATKKQAANLFSVLVLIGAAYGKEIGLKQWNAASFFLKSVSKSPKRSSKKRFLAFDLFGEQNEPLSNYAKHCKAFLEIDKLFPDLFFVLPQGSSFCSVSKVLVA